MAKKSLIKSIHDTMWDLMAGDERVLIMGEDVGTRGGVFRATEGFVDKFGEERVIDTPLAESSIVGIGIGLALGSTSAFFLASALLVCTLPDRSGEPLDE